MIALILCAGLSLPVIPPRYNFTVYQGPSSRTYTNTWLVGYPKCDATGTNFCATNGVPDSSNFFAVTVKNHTGLESDYSNETNISGATNVALAWSWQLASLPVTNIVQISAGTNSLTFTNPAAGMTFYRLYGQSWTSAVVQAANYVNWQWRWVAIATWSYPSNSVPALSIRRL